MNLLITGADTPLGALAAEHFGRDHSLVKLARDPSNAPDDMQAADLRRRDQVDRLIAGVDAVLDLAWFAPTVPPGRLGEQDLLETASLGTYNLLLAGRLSGCLRTVLASPLAMLDAYDPDYLIDELWRPWPDTRAESLAPFLAERVCRELALEGPNEVTCLRLSPLGQGPTDTRPGDALAAIERALQRPIEMPGRRWDVFHVTSDARFIVTSARRTLGLEIEQVKS